MATITKNVPLLFLHLPPEKAQEFARLERLNTKIANRIRSMPKKRIRGLTSDHFSEAEIDGHWIDRTIANVGAKKRVKNILSMPLETSGENWAVYQTREGFCISFKLLKRDGTLSHFRVAGHRKILKDILIGKAKTDRLQLRLSKRGGWYASILVSMEIPESEVKNRWIGVDLGSNVPVAAVSPDDTAVLWEAGHILELRKALADCREKLQNLKETEAVQYLESLERRIVADFNQGISKDLVNMARRFGSGIRLEDFPGFRKKDKSREEEGPKDGENLFSWSFRHLESLIRKKALAENIPLDVVSRHYTSQTCHRCGAINQRNGSRYKCDRCGYEAHADVNAARNIRDWYGRHCPLDIADLAQSR